MEPKDFWRNCECWNNTKLCIHYWVKRTTYLERLKKGMSPAQALWLEPILQIEDFNNDDLKYIKQLWKT